MIVVCTLGAGASRNLLYRSAEAARCDLPSRRRLGLIKEVAMGLIFNARY